MEETMPPARSLTVASFLIAIGALPALSPGPAAARVILIQAHPMEVTSDTPAYCSHLLDRVNELVSLAASPVPLEVTNLTTEGERMCANGRTRSGIMRLRSALIMMEKGNGPAYR